MKKKKKNGFTLVELLGVIVVLAILALITVPIISNIVANARINALRDSAYGLIEAGNLYYAQYGNNSNLRFDINDNKVSSRDTDKLLTYKGTVKSGTVILDRKGNVTVCITDGHNSAYKNYNESKVATKKGQTCSIDTNSYIVKLSDDGETLKELNNQALTDEVATIKERLDNLETKQNNNLNEVYPVGSVYISFNNTNPSELFGGTWEQIESGRMLQSTTTTSGQIGGNSTYSYTPEGTVGDTKLLEEHIPSHRFRVNWGTGNGPQLVGKHSDYPEVTGFTFQALTDMCCSYTTIRGEGIYTNIYGGSQPHKHSFTGTTEDIKTVPPYITVYMYKRTA